MLVDPQFFSVISGELEKLQRVLGALCGALQFEQAMGGKFAPPGIGEIRNRLRDLYMSVGEARQMCQNLWDQYIAALGGGPAAVRQFGEPRGVFEETARISSLLTQDLYELAAFNRIETALGKTFVPPNWPMLVRQLAQSRDCLGEALKVAAAMRREYLVEVSGSRQRRG